MNVLFATGSPASYMLPPVLGDCQVNCGPDWTDQAAPDGRVRSLATPLGRYDLAAIAAKLPAAQNPDVVVCLVDASWRNLPSNLAAFSCPKVLLIADTHHMQSPLVGLLRYMAAESFDRHIFLYDRHHAAFFHAAGFNTLFWLPGLTFPHGDAAVRAARARENRTPQIAFVGQAGKHHPRRARLLAALQQRKLPVVAKGLRQTEALGFYGSSLLGFNASLNGDWNLRVLEIMAAGGALLTDALAPEAGMEKFFADGRDCLLYRSPEELAERAAQALARPQETRAIGAAAARWFDENYGEMRRRELFRAVAFDGEAAPEFEFSAAEKTRVFLGGDTDRLLESLEVYEGIQEIHRTEEAVRVQIAATEPADLKALFSTLPRVVCPEQAEAEPADLTVFNRECLEQGIAFNSPMVWCWNAQPADFDLLARGLAPAGYVLASQQVALLCQSTEPATPRPLPSEPNTMVAGPLALTLGISVGAGGGAGLPHLLQTLAPQASRLADRIELIVLDATTGDAVGQAVAQFNRQIPLTHVRVGASRAAVITALASERAQGVFTWLLDESDRLEASALASVLAAITQHPAVDFFYAPAAGEERQRTDLTPRRRAALTFEDLLAPVLAEEVRGVTGGSIFRTKVWRLLPGESAEGVLAQACPFGLGLAHTMVGRSAGRLAEPVRIAVRATERTPQEILQRLPQLLALFALKGVATKPLAAAREVLARSCREALREMVLDPSTPGAAEFEVEAFLAEHHVGAHMILDYLDEIVLEAGLRSIDNRLVAQARKLVQLYPSQKIAVPTPVVTNTLKSVAAFQAAVKQADEFIRAGALREATAELERAKLCAPDAACAAKAEQVLEAIRAAAMPAPTQEESETVFSEEERANIMGIIAAYQQTPTNPELLGQLRSLQSGLADFLRRAETERIPALFEGDFGQIFREIVALHLGDDPAGPASGELVDAVRAGYATAGRFDVGPLLHHLTTTTSRSPQSYVYQ